jgi:hypothetical protein
MAVALLHPKVVTMALVALTLRSLFPVNMYPVVVALIRSMFAVFVMHPHIVSVAAGHSRSSL